MLQGRSSAHQLKLLLQLKNGELKMTCTMLSRTLGNTGLKVSEIGFGCASFWGKKIFNEAEAIDLVHLAIAGGVTFFDTGSSYSGGNAEPRLGLALSRLASTKKHELVVATKAGTCLGKYGRLYKDFSPISVRKSVESSLARLTLDTIPLLQLHGPEMSDFTDELLTTLVRLKEEGKIRNLGVNSFNMNVIEYVMTLPQFGVVMIDYNIIRPERDGIIKKLASQKFGVLAGMALAGGLYSDQRFKIKGLHDLWYAARALKNHRSDIMRGRRFHFINHEDGWTGDNIALAWVLRNPDISCAVIGTTRQSHLLSNLNASGRTLSADTYNKIGRINAGTLKKNR